jgi:hypothetical protein
MWPFLIILAAVLLSVLVGAWRDHGYIRSSPASMWRSSIVGALLSLEDEPLAELFKLYRNQFGPGAARYARHTYEKWRNGQVNPTRRTFNRLAIHLPSVMTFDLKCELLRTLKLEFCERDNHELTVYTDGWKEPLAPLVTNMIARSYTASLPMDVVKQLGWLSANDMTVANAMLAEAQARETRQAVSLLNEDFSAIDNLLREANGHSRVVHVIELPYGTLTLHIKRRQSSDAR